MLRIRKVSEVIGKNAYTSEGDFFGQIEEANLSDNRIDGWKIKIGSGFINLLGGARGVIIPHQFIKAVGDVIIVNKSSLPIQAENPEVDFSSQPKDNGSIELI